MTTSRAASGLDDAAAYGGGRLCTGKSYSGDALVFYLPPVAPGPQARAGSALARALACATRVAVVPTIQNVTPAPGSVITPSTAIEFDIIDNEPMPFIGLQCAQYLREVVHDGSAFLDPYLTSTRTTLAGQNGYHYRIVRANGWQVSPTFYVFAVDDRGGTS